MSDLIKQLSKPLTKNDVELRTGSVSAKGITLLVYKTARTDVNRLNEVCGTKWNNRHFYDSQGLLCCSIGIYDDDLKQWVFREDVGTESFTEKDFEYGVKILNACMERKAKEIGGNYTLVIKPLKKANLTSNIVLM